MKDSDDLNEIRRLIYDQPKKAFERCFFPFHSCRKKSIKAHSIQNNGVLDKLSSNGHVIMIHPVQNLDTGPKVEFKKIGKNRATTFTGLCGEHDNLLFEKIDKGEIDVTDKEHLFLLAYRSILKELHAKMKAAVDIQTIYQKGVEIGKFNPNIRDEAFWKPTIAISESYTFYLHKFFYDKVLSTQQFSKIKHFVLSYKCQEPTIAVSSAYSLIDNFKRHEDRQDPKVIALNVFPQQDKVHVVLSYKEEHTQFVSAHLSEISLANLPYQQYLVSKLILTHCENFTLSPLYYNKMNESKRQHILKYFLDNVGVDKQENDDERLFLF